MCFSAGRSRSLHHHRNPCGAAFWCTSTGLKFSRGSTCQDAEMNVSIFLHLAEEQSGNVSASPVPSSGRNLSEEPAAYVFMFYRGADASRLEEERQFGCNVPGRRCCRAPRGTSCYVLQRNSIQIKCSGSFPSWNDLTT